MSLVSDIPDDIDLVEGCLESIIAMAMSSLNALRRPPWYAEYDALG